MNKEYTQINDTDYIVSSDNGTIDLVKANDNIEEILIKENEIEDIYDDIFDKKRSLDIIKNKDNMRKDLNKVFIIIGIISAITGYFTPIGIVTMLATMISGIFAFKLLFSLISGTKKSNLREITALNSSIKLDMQKVQDLTKELEELKAKSNYRAMPYLETQINPMQQPTYGYSQNKIKRLVIDK